MASPTVFKFVVASKFERSTRHHQLQLQREHIHPTHCRLSFTHTVIIFILRLPRHTTHEFTRFLRDDSGGRATGHIRFEANKLLSSTSPLHDPLHVQFPTPVHLTSTSTPTPTSTPHPPPNHSPLQPPPCQPNKQLEPNRRSRSRSRARRRS